jgi:hypothetical protein
MERQRERKIDLSKLNQADIDLLSVSIGEKVRSICDEACAKANLLLNIYNMEAKMAFKINQIGNLTQENELLPAQKKRGRPKKSSNLKNV